MYPSSTYGNESNTCVIHDSRIASRGGRRVLIFILHKLPLASPQHLNHPAPFLLTMSSSKHSYNNNDDIEDSKPPAKRTRRGRPKKAESEEDSGDEKSDGKNANDNNATPLPIDALMVVMEFLHPRDLLNTGELKLYMPINLGYCQC